MQPQLCSRCKKNIAVVFITRQENGQNVNEGLCLKCAKNLGLPQVDEMMRRMGITDEDLDNISNEMMGAFGGAESLEGLTDADDPDADNEDEDGKTATFPFLSRFFGGSPAANDASGGEAEQTQSPRSNKKAEKGSKHKFLDSYCINLSQRARDGKLDAVIGRAEEIERVIQILNRRQKNNPCLIGEPGVGKTAIAEGLAQRIVAGEVPFKLRSKEVYLLDLTALVAGTQFRGQFESRMKGLIEEIRKMGNVILVIDEVHNIVGAGDAEGSMNAANILKPALSRGEIQVIGATTFTEYRKHIEKDTALERRFQPVTVNEPNMEDTLKILKGIAHYYEQYHGVKIPEGILRQAVLLSERYITDRFLPDKAIDLIDEACSDLNLHDKNINRRMELRREIEDYDKERELLQGAEEPDFERLAELKSLTMKAQEELDALCAQGDPQLSMDNLARVIELWTKIPASRIREDEFHRLSELDKRLKEHIVGQDEAIEAVSAAIRRNRVGISPKHKPVSFIFVGPTGVGKTELVKQLAQDLFNSPDALIRLDMSEFMEKHSVSRIVGSPPGYVGYDAGGTLTEKVRRRPYCVVLFDELEKAHRDITGILLQLLGDGILTDSMGRTVSFKNTIVVMTSNLTGPQTGKPGLGFIPDCADVRAQTVLREAFSPEFLGRIDCVASFRPLAAEDLAKIAALQLRELAGRLQKQNVTLETAPELPERLGALCANEPGGARSLRRRLQTGIEGPAAELLLRDPSVRTLRAVWQQGSVQVKAAGGCF